MFLTPEEIENIVKTYKTKDIDEESFNHIIQIENTMKRRKLSMEAFPIAKE